MTIVTADIEQATLVLNSGGVIAYPTEAVFGLGCAAGNETAVRKILKLKQRPIHMGLISLIKDLTQVLPWLDVGYQHLWPKAQASWPAAVTWLFPCSAEAPEWLTGGSSRIALRCPDHPLAGRLCEHGPLVSTSANPAGQTPAVTAVQVRQYFPDELDLIIDGKCGSYSNSSQIRDLVTGESLR